MKPSAARLRSALKEVHRCADADSDEAEAANAGRNDPSGTRMSTSVMEPLVGQEAIGSDREQVERKYAESQLEDSITGLWPMLPVSL